MCASKSRVVVQVAETIRQSRDSGTAQSIATSASSAFDFVEGHDTSDRANPSATWQSSGWIDWGTGDFARTARVDAAVAPAQPSDDLSQAASMAPRTGHLLAKSYRPELSPHPTMAPKRATFHGPAKSCRKRRVWTPSIGLVDSWKAARRCMPFTP